MGLIDFQERAKVEQFILNATYQNRARQWRELHHSFGEVLDYIVDNSGNVNVYDITTYHRYPTILVSQYFDTPEIASLFALNR